MEISRFGLLAHHVVLKAESKLIEILMLLEIRMILKLLIVFKKIWKSRWLNTPFPPNMTLELAIQ